MALATILCHHGLRELQNNKALKHRDKDKKQEERLRELQNNKALKHGHSKSVVCCGLRELQNNKALKRFGNYSL